MSSYIKNLNVSPLVSAGFITYGGLYKMFTVFFITGDPPSYDQLEQEEKSGMYQSRISESKGGTKYVRPPRSNFFHFHAVFGQNLAQ